MKVSDSVYKQGGKYHYEIREGDVLRGILLSVGHGYESRAEALKEKNKAMRKVARLIR